MSALDRVMLAAGRSPAAPAEEDPAGELVLAAASALAELRVMLAKPDADDDNDGDEADDNEQTASGKHAGHPTYKQMIKKGLKPSEAAAMCSKSDKKVAASALCEAAIVALAGLEIPSGSWVQRTALDTWTVGLAGDDDGNTSQGAGEDYTDPGYQQDGKKRYPTTKGGKLDATRIRAAWSYINQKDNAGEYSPGQLAKIKAKIKAAAAKAGVQIGDDAEKVAASMVELAAKQADAMMADAHPPFHGVHSHKHVHHGDNMHGGSSDRMAPQYGGY